MNKLPWMLSLLLAVLGTSANGAELWVDGSAAREGNGSAAAPLRSISDALKVARGGDTITVRAGTYHESVSVRLSGNAAQPTVLRAAAGERVVLSGFAPIRDWKPEAGGLYSAIIDDTLDSLYVGLQPQEVSRWPDMDQPMRYVKDVDPKGGSFHDDQPLPGEPPLKELAADVKSAMAFIYVTKLNGFTTIPVARVDLPSGQVTLRSAERYAAGGKGGKGRADRYQFVNHPSLILKPGQWAYVKSGERVRVYFRPSDPSDLARTQYRKEKRQLISVGGGGETVSHVRIEGLELCGSAKDGLAILGSRDVVVSRCIAHNNGYVGMSSRRSDDVQFKNNIILLNGNGLSVASAHNALVEGNEVAMNMVDGIHVVGNPAHRSDESNTQGATVRRNYVHHHLLLGHPDNIQSFSGVKDYTIEDNVLLFGGQAIMTEGVDGASLRNCVVVGTEAGAIKFGHESSNNWTVRNVTVGLGGYGAFTLSGKNYRLEDNIIWNNDLHMADSLTSDYNLFYLVDDQQRMAVMPTPTWHDFQTPAEAAAATGQERHSRRIHPQFRNAPYCQAVAAWDDSNRADRIVFRPSRKTAADLGFQTGDQVEINGDGVCRRVTAVEASAIRFDPPLPRRPFRDALIWNWKKAASMTLDLRPPTGGAALTAGQNSKPVGADLDIAAFQRGEFTRPGQRDIPLLPDDLRTALPSPNAIVIPLHGE